MPESANVIGCHRGRYCAFIRQLGITNMNRRRRTTAGMPPQAVLTLMRKPGVEGVKSPRGRTRGATKRWVARRRHERCRSKKDFGTSRWRHRHRATSLSQPSEGPMAGLGTIAPSENLRCPAMPLIVVGPARMSLPGTKRTSRAGRSMSVDRGKAEVAFQGREGSF